MGFKVLVFKAVRADEKYFRDILLQDSKNEKLYQSFFHSCWQKVKEALS